MRPSLVGLLSNISRVRNTSPSAINLVTSPSAINLVTSPSAINLVTSRAGDDALDQDASLSGLPYARCTRRYLCSVAGVVAALLGADDETGASSSSSSTLSWKLRRMRVRCSGDVHGGWTLSERQPTKCGGSFWKTHFQPVMTPRTTMG